MCGETCRGILNNYDKQWETSVFLHFLCICNCKVTSTLSLPRTLHKVSAFLQTSYPRLFQRMGSYAQSLLSFGAWVWVYIRVQDLTATMYLGFQASPLCHMSNQGSPEALLKLQMAPRFILWMSLGSKKKEPRSACLSEAKASHSQRIWAEVTSITPHFLHNGLSTSASR
jgi:hypothetical protein